MKNVAAVILAAGKGTRMKSALPKVTHEVSGLPLINHVVNQVKRIGIRKIIVVVGYRKELVIDCLKNDGVTIVQQKQQLGTAHALVTAKKKLRSFRGHVLVLAGDVFFENIKTLRSFCSHKKKHNYDMCILTTMLDNPHGYGRIVRDAQDKVIAIREELDATKRERCIQEVNSGIYLFKATTLFSLLYKVKKNKRKEEYYLTDVVPVYLAHKKCVGGYLMHGSGSLIGVNNRAQLASIQRIVKERIIYEHQLNGVTVIEPAGTYIECNVRIGNDTVIYPYTYIEKNVRIGSGCIIGPFCKIRSGSTIAHHSIIGSFVEIVRSHVGSKTNIKHLSYIGDTTVGDQVNIGAGTITANYDGKKKNKTKIGNGAFIGSDTVLIAPLTVGTGACTGAGAIVPRGRNIPAGKIALGVPARIVKQRKS